MSEKGEEVTAAPAVEESGDKWNTARLKESFGELKARVNQRTEELKERLKEKSSESVPSELRVRKRLEACLEDMVIGAGTGMLVGGVASLIVFRSKSPRLLITGFGAGFGAGSAYTSSSTSLVKETSRTKSD